MSGTSTPERIPVLVPRAPGYRPNRLSKLRFSSIRYTTCLMGHRVSTPAGVAPNDGLGVGLVDRRSPMHDVMNAPAAAAADRDMKSRRVRRRGYTSVGLCVHGSARAEDKWSRRGGATTAVQLARENLRTSAVHPVSSAFFRSGQVRKKRPRPVRRRGGGWDGGTG